MGAGVLQTNKAGSLDSPLQLRSWESPLLSLCLSGSAYACFIDNVQILVALSRRNGGKYVYAILLEVTDLTHFEHSKSQFVKPFY